MGIVPCGINLDHVSEVGGSPVRQLTHMVGKMVLAEGCELSGAVRQHHSFLTMWAS